MGASLGSKKAFGDINMTPLIDIVLVVLIIMMVSIPIQVEQMPIKLPAPPQPNQEPPPPNPDQLLIALYPDGTVALNRKQMTEDVLLYEVTRRLRPLEHKNVFIDAAPTANYGKVVELMNLARAAGAAKVGLAKMKPEGPQPPTSFAPGAAPRGIVVGAANVVGDMDAGDADAQIKPLYASIEQCYFTQLATKPELNGRVMAKVDVGPQGEIMDHKISTSTLDDPETEACVDALVGTLKFHPLGYQKTAAVLYPILFSPG